MKVKIRRRRMSLINITEEIERIKKRKTKL